MKGVRFSLFAFIIMAGCKNQDPSFNTNSTIGSGQMPSLVKDEGGDLHLAYGSGDSIMYAYSSDNGATFPRRP